MKTLRDKVVVITGAGSGIGRALALACAGRGARLLLADIDTAALADTTRQALALGAQCRQLRTDTAQEGDLHALAQDCALCYGHADVVVNNAGVGLVASTEKLRTEDAQWLMNINFWGVVHGCRAFLPQLRQRPEALLVNVSSIFAMVSIPTQGMYNASKAAVRGFSDALREELRETPVRVLCVHPGGIRTQIANRSRMADISLTEMTEQELRDNFEQNARSTPEQAAAAIVRAVETGRTRLLIGADARLLDLLYRLAPAHASRWLSALVRRRRRQVVARRGR